jgi:hypothetical protein
MPFSLPGDPSQTEISDAINYLLNNFGSNVSVDVNTGIVAGPVGGIGYLYKYLDIKYATSYDGSVGFSNSPTNATYYGARNNNSSVESSNPTDYIWTQVTGGFGTTKFLFYQTTGGRQINIVVATTAPSASYVQDSGSAIDLDVVTGASGVSGASGYSGYSGSSGLSGYSGLSGFSGTVGANGLAALTAYLVQSQSSSAPSTPANTTGPTAPSGWSLTAPSVSVGQVLWYSFGQYNSSSGTISGIPAGQTQWGAPTAASIFQDIESDNWNGSTPPTYGSSGTYGTSGYYIVRSTGDVYFNRGVFRGDVTGASGIFSGDIITTGNGIFKGNSGSAPASLGTGALVANSTNTTNSGVIGYGYGASVFSQGYGVIGYANNIYSGGVYGYASGSSVSGVNGINSGSGAGVTATNTGSGPALAVNGPMTISSNTLVTNLYSQYTVYLKGQGTGGYNLYFNTGPTTGSAPSITFNPLNKPGTNGGANQWIEIVIGTTSYQIPVWIS